MKKKEKILLVENLTKEFKSAKSTVFIDFAKMNVRLQQQLKKEIKAAGGRMLVVKNTLIKKAGEAAGFDPKVVEDKVLTGQTAVILGEGDPIAPIQAVGKFLKKSEVPHLKVGIVEGIFQDKNALTILSNLPGRDVLTGQVVGTIASPMYSLISTLSTKMQEVIMILNTKAG